MRISLVVYRRLRCLEVRTDHEAPGWGVEISFVPRDTFGEGHWFSENGKTSASVSRPKIGPVTRGGGYRGVEDRLIIRNGKMRDKWGTTGIGRGTTGTGSRGTTGTGRDGRGQ